MSEEPRVFWYDQDAYMSMPQYRHLYDRLQLSWLLGYEAQPHGIEPKRYPVFSKPIINLHGLGAGVRVLKDRHDYDSACRPGYFWMPYFKGRHLSICGIVGKREFVPVAVAEMVQRLTDPHPSWRIGMKPPYPEAFECAQFVRAHLPRYHGLLNVELIGRRIIEVHLRGAFEFLSCYPKENRSAMMKADSQAVLATWPVVPGGWGYIVPFYGVSTPKPGRINAWQDKLAKDDNGKRGQVCIEWKEPYTMVPSGVGKGWRWGYYVGPDLELGWRIRDEVIGSE